MADSAVLFDRPIPETQVSPPYPTVVSAVTGAIVITGGFMEPHGHGFKSRARRAIFADGSLRRCEPGHYNIGIDYSRGFGSEVICLYSGQVVKAGFEAGYGYRIHIQLAFPFHYQGHTYPCFQAYAHCSRLLRGVGDQVRQGEAIALEAGHGSHGPHDYGSHVDLDTYCLIHGETIHLNPDLLAAALRPAGRIAAFRVLRQGDRGGAVRWLQLQLNVEADAHFGPATRRAVEAFQRAQGDLVVDGEAGEQTCRRLGLVGYALLIQRPTSLKPGSSGATAEPVRLAGGDPPALLQATWVQDQGSHWLFELRQPLQGRFNWQLAKPDVHVIRGYPAADERWERALEQCPSAGCSLATARAEGLETGGVSASHTILERDLVHLDAERIRILQSAARRFAVPLALIVALASRESHLGTWLGRFGNSPGWGDGDQAWGVLQVDRRFHAVAGLEDPWSQAHVDQAIGILADVRDQVQRRHPQWDAGALLKGACVAYNSGVANVVTIAAMNLGTTHDDYGDDVIARAQHYQRRQRAQQQRSAQ